jgi:hypothetical protein
MLGSDAHGAPCRAHLLLDEGRFFLRLQRTLDLVLSFCTSTRGLPCTGNRRAVQMRGTSSGSRRRRRLYTAIVIGHARPCGSRSCSVQRLSRRTVARVEPRPTWPDQKLAAHALLACRRTCTTQRVARSQRLVVRRPPVLHARRRADGGCLMSTCATSSARALHLTLALYHVSKAAQARRHTR